MTNHVVSDGSDPECPLRPGDGCNLCVPGATGPETCGLVYLVLTDHELCVALARLRGRR
jgi:hypothetical protein